MPWKSKKATWSSTLAAGRGSCPSSAAKLGAAKVYGLDAAPDVVEVASANAERHGVAEVTTFLQGRPLRAPSERRDGRHRDRRRVRHSGPPGRRERLVSQQAGWRGREVPSSRSGCWRTSRTCLRRGGQFFLPTGTLQDEAAILEKAKSIFSKLTQVRERAIPLPTALSQSAEVLQLMKDRVIDLKERGSRKLWTAKVWVGSLT